MEKYRRRHLMCMELAIALLLLMDALAWGYRGYPGTVGFYMVRISNFMVFLLSVIILILYHSYVCSHLFAGVEWKKRPRRVYVVYGIGAVGIFLVVLSQFTNLYYYFDADNFYHRNTMYPLSLLVAATIMGMDFSLLVKYRKRLKRAIFISLISYIVLPTIATIMLFFYYGVSLVNISINISAIFMFIVAMAEQSKMLAEKERELSDLRIEMMLSQIKPHFIFNTLTTIRYLCKTNPEEAADVLDDFSGYLRGNIDSLTVKGNIPFSQELDHAKKYLAIEKKRFGERIRIEYAIEVEDFSLPVLTLQPIVENAVKHGITKRLEGGTIRISTRREADVCVITVEDDGIGFDVGIISEEKECSHVGVSNVKSRLESMCGGNLNIVSTPGKGTVVEIHIPG